MGSRVLGRLGAEVGDEIETGGVGRLEIVGSVELPSCLGCDPALIAPGSLILAQGWVDNGVRVLVDLPDSVTGAEIQQMLDDGQGRVLARGYEAPIDGTEDGTTGVRGASVRQSAARRVGKESE